MIKTSHIMKIFTIIIIKIIFFYSTFLSAEVKIAALYAESGPVSEIAEAIVRSVLGSLDHLIIKKNLTLLKLNNLNNFLVRMKQSKIWLNFDKNL